MPRLIAAGTIVIAIALVLLLARVPSDELEVTLPSIGSLPAEPDLAIARADEVPTAPGETSAAAKVRELQAMSETFRNTTFLIAIRDAGFVCNELLRVYGGLDESAKWMATCSEMLAYTLSVADNGTLRVDPMLQYFDGVLQRINLQQDPAAPLQGVPIDRALRDSLPPETR
jgi:hypothetical protein